MVPPRDDPRWVQIVTDTSTPAVEGLSTRMMLMRVKQILNFDPSRVSDAVEIAHSFFVKNEAMCARDIDTLFRTRKP